MMDVAKLAAVRVLSSRLVRAFDEHGRGSREYVAAYNAYAKEVGRPTISYDSPCTLVQNDYIEENHQGDNK